MSRCHFFALMLNMIMTDVVLDDMRQFSFACRWNISVLFSDTVHCQISFPSMLLWAAACFNLMYNDHFHFGLKFRFPAKFCSDALRLLDMSLFSTTGPSGTREDNYIDKNCHFAWIVSTCGRVKTRIVIRTSYVWKCNQFGKLRKNGYRPASLSSASAGPSPRQKVQHDEDRLSSQWVDALPMTFLTQ